MLNRIAYDIKIPESQSKIPIDKSPSTCPPFPSRILLFGANARHWFDINQCPRRNSLASISPPTCNIIWLNNPEKPVTLEGISCEHVFSLGRGWREKLNCSLNLPQQWKSDVGQNKGSKDCEHSRRDAQDSVARVNPKPIVLHWTLGPSSGALRSSKFHEQAFIPKWWCTADKPFTAPPSQTTTQLTRKIPQFASKSENLSRYSFILIIPSSPAAKTTLHQDPIFFAPELFLLGCRVVMQINGELMGFKFIKGKATFSTFFPPPLPFPHSHSPHNFTNWVDQHGQVNIIIGSGTIDTK